MGFDIPSISSTARILVVDDDRLLGDLLGEWVREKWECDTVYDGREAMAKMNDGVDIVLLDRQMPGMSGEEVLEEIRNERFPAQVLMVSAVEPDFELLELPIDDYLQKPVTRPSLQAKIEELLLRRIYLPTVEKFFVCMAKLEVLETTKSPTELAENDRYLELRMKADELRQDAKATLGHMSDHVVEFHETGSAD